MFLGANVLNSWCLLLKLTLPDLCMRCTRAEQACLGNTWLIWLPKNCVKTADADPLVVIILTCSAPLWLPLILDIRETNMTSTWDHHIQLHRAGWKSLYFLWILFHLPGRSQFTVVQRKNEDEILVPGELEHPYRKGDTRMPRVMKFKYKVKLQQYLGPSSGR